MQLPEFPVALGVIRKVEAPVYDYEMVAQINQVQQTAKVKCVDDLLKSGNTWEVK
jgi:2-oxoglutarate ferredoxin oxidoreductase subunit beta